MAPVQKQPTFVIVITTNLTNANPVEDISKPPKKSKKAFEMSDASISSAENIVFVELVFNLASASNWDSASTRTSVFDWNDVKNKF